MAQDFRQDWNTESKGTQRWLVVAVLVVCAASAVAFFWWRAESQPTHYEFHTLQRQDLTASCDFDAVLTAAQGIDFYCQVAARTLEDGQRQPAELLWIVPHGTRVQEGELLAEFDASYVRDERDNWQIKAIKSEGELKQATLRYDNEQTRRQTEMSTAESTLASILKDGKQPLEPGLEETRNLLKAVKSAQAGASPDELRLAAIGLRERLGLEKSPALDDIRLKEQIANFGLLEAINFFASQAQQAGDSSRAAIGVAAEQAYRVLAQSQREYLSTMDRLLTKKSSAATSWRRENERAEHFAQQVAHCRIIAPRDGLIEHVVAPGETELLAPGDVVRERQKILILHDLSHMTLSAKVYAPSRQHLQMGADAYIDFQTGSGTMDHGTITKLEDRESYSLVTVSPDPPCRLGPGATARVMIPFRDCPNALCIPATAVFTWNGDSYCFVRAGDAVQQQAITLGVETTQYFEVLSGLREGDRVVLDANTVDVQL